MCECPQVQALPIKGIRREGGLQKLCKIQAQRGQVGGLIRVKMGNEMLQMAV